MKKLSKLFLQTPACTYMACSKFFWSSPITLSNYKRDAYTVLLALKSGDN